MHSTGERFDEDDTLARAPIDSGIRRLARPLSVAPPAGPARYQVRQLLGRGGMGDVHACEDARIGREVAIKLLRDPSGVAIDRFVREARLQGRLEHPAIVPVYDLGTTDQGIPFFTMKRVRGVTLAEVIAGLREGDPEIARRHSLRKLLTAFAQVCLAVDYAHRRGVVHRDLKPHNVMLGRFGEVHVLDWGCATRLDGDADDRDDEAGSAIDVAALVPHAALSQRGDVIGTPGYLAPEQARGQGACARSDVYALGAILFEILTLRPLHGGATAVARLVATIQGTSETRPSRRDPGLTIAPALDDLVVRALAHEAAARPDARELADGIERVLDEETVRMNARDRATRHAQAARDAAVRALDRRDDDSRAIALREAGRALALDPENAPARAALASLLVQPPDEAPPEARAALEEVDRELARGAVRAMSMRVAIWGAFTVFAILLGVRDWRAAGVAIAAIVALGAGLAIVRATGASGRGARFALLGLTTLGVASIGGLFGPFVMVSAFAATSATYFALAYGRAERIAAALLGVGAVAVPYALELAGVLPASTTITPEAIVLHPRLVSFPPVATAIFLVLGNVLTVPVNVLAAGRVRDALDAARRRLALHAWQLERIIS